MQFDSCPPCGDLGSGSRWTLMWRMQYNPPDYGLIPRQLKVLRMVHASGPRYTQELQRASGIAPGMVRYTCMALEGKGLLVRRRVRHTSPEYRGERRGLGSWLWSTTPEAELMLAHDPCPEAPVEPLPYMPLQGPRPVSTSTDMEILRAMGDEPVSVARLMTSLRRSNTCIYTHLHRLEASGDVRKYWDGERYQWVVA